MSNSDIPDAANYQVAQEAIAWAMVKLSVLRLTGEADDKYLKRLIDAYNVALSGIAGGKVPKAS